MSDVNELVPLELSTINVLDIERDYIYSAFAVQAAKKYREGVTWNFADFTREALLTFASGVR